MGTLVAGLVLALALVLPHPLPAAEPGDAEYLVDSWTPDGASDASLRALAGSYTGFGAAATGGEGRPLLTVTALADSGLGSLRSVLDAAGRLGGGRIVFAVGGDLVLHDALRVPANVTLDGLTAPPPGITLWGERMSTGGGVLEIRASNVIVRGLRIRNAVNDGIQIAAKHGSSIARIVIDHCSITNSGDGGVDVTGSADALVRDVTLSWNYLAANGGLCATKGWCGGGTLVKYGVERISVHGNVWDKNLRRNPSIDGSETLADVRGNVVHGYVESGTQLRNGAAGNVVGNFFAGHRPLLTTGAFVFAAANEGATVASVATPFDVADPLDVVTHAGVIASAGAPPHDAIDAAYREALATYEAAKNAPVGIGIGDAGFVDAGNGDAAPDGSAAHQATRPLGATTLATARVELRGAHAARRRGDRARAYAGYQSVLTRLAGARGLHARPAAATQADAALALALLTQADRATALAHADAAVAHARRSGHTGRERQTQRLLRRLLR